MQPVFYGGHYMQLPSESICIADVLIAAAGILVAFKLESTQQWLACWPFPLP